MRLSTILLPLLSLLPAAMADGASTSCTSTMTSTRTVLYVVTETHTGSPSAPANSTSLVPTYASVKPSMSANGTVTRAPTSAAPVAPTSASPFPGAAGQMVVPQIMVGVVAAGAGLLFL